MKLVYAVGAVSICAAAVSGKAPLFLGNSSGASERIPPPLDPVPLPSALRSPQAAPAQHATTRVHSPPSPPSPPAEEGDIAKAQEVKAPEIKAPERNTAKAPDLVKAPVQAPVVKLSVKMPQKQQQPVATAMPRVHFLFLAVDKISNIGIWKAFFSQGQPEHFRAFVHCKTEACKAQVLGSGMQIQMVPTVPSYYCTDLVSPMNQLLTSALTADQYHNHPSDKFAFVSDSTLPAKPFTHVYATLTGRQGSDFCVFPSKEWADRASPQGGLQMLPKHHQWVTLDREHATRATTLWARGAMHGLMQQYRMNSLPLTWGNNSFADNRNFGCLDEFWHMAALYGPLEHVVHSPSGAVALPRFAGGPLHITADAGWQGTCDTFVIWLKYLGAEGGISNPFQRLHTSLDQPSVPHSGNSQRPGWWDKLSMTGMRAIKASDFLFVRKFIDNPSLTDGGNFEPAYVQQVLT